jgi:hypothetical protein
MDLGGEETSAASRAASSIASGNFVEAMFWSFLDVSKKNDDATVLRLADATERTLGSDAARVILTSYDDPVRGARYKYALSSYLVAKGELDKAKMTTRNILLEQDVRIEDVVADIRLRVLLGETSEAIRRVNLRQPEIVCNVWAAMVIVKLLVHEDSARSVLEPIIEFLDKSRAELEDDDKANLAFLCSMQGNFGTGRDKQYASIQEHPDIDLYVSANSYNSSHQIADALMTSTRFLEAPVIAERLHRALSNKIGFSVVRVGDGEGRFMPGLAQYPEIQSDSVKVAQRIWFWNSRYFPNTEFFERFRHAYLQADIVGINPPLRLRVERGNCLGYVGVTNGNRFIRDNLQSSAYDLSYNWINVLLCQNDILKNLIIRADNVSIISPHAEYPSSLFFGKKHVRYLRIPSENHELVKGNSVSEPHYPDVFNKMIEEIRSIPQGLVLVAGGIFGKIYCHEVKKAGSVAIDLGSVVDQWVGLKTR